MVDISRISPEQARTKKTLGLGMGMLGGGDTDFDPATDDPNDPDAILRQLKPVGVYSGMQGLASIGQGLENMATRNRAEQARGEQRQSQRAASEAMSNFMMGGGMLSDPAAIAPLLAHPGTRATGMQFYMDAQREKRARETEERQFQRQQQDPLRQAQIRETEAQAAERLANAKRRDLDTSQTPDKIIQDRMAQAKAAGLTETDPGYRSFLLTGKMPREDQQPLTATDKKAILEADDGVVNNTAVITALDQAMKLSPQTNSGWGASTRAAIGNNLPDWLVPDRISSPESSRATADYENLVIGQALTQLKTTFGSAPTEGERQILLDLQASVGKPHEVRVEILNRARAAAQRRLEFSKSQADGLRGQTYYKPGGNVAQAPAAPATPQALPGGWKIQKVE